MLYYISNSHDPYHHQALEEVLFHRPTSDDIYLLWINDPAIVFGSYQNPFKEINFDFAWENNVPIIRRISGGGTVYHDHGNINYSVIKNENPEKMDYKVVMGPMVKALQSLGYPVDHRNSCDIYLGDWKISGNAQKMSKGRLLHHGTLLYDSDLDQLKQSGSKKQDQIESKGIPSRPAHVGNLRGDYGGWPTARAFMEALAQAWIPAEAELLALTAEEEAEVDRLTREKYRDAVWTYGKAPAHTYHSCFSWNGADVEVDYSAKNGQIVEGQICKDGKILEEASLALTGMALNKAALTDYCSSYFDASLLYEFI